MGIYLWNTSLKNISLWGSSVKSVHLWSDLVWPVWRPWENTIAYIPMRDDIIEKSGNSSFTNYSVTNTTINGIKCWYFNGSARLETNIPSFSNVNHTFNLWYKRNWWSFAWFLSSNPCGVYAWEVFWYNNNNQLVYENYPSSSWFRSIVWTVSTQSDWHNLCFSWGNIYCDWVLLASNSGSFGGNYNFTIWWHTTWSSCTRQFITWYMSELIIESVVRTAQEIANYYNQTKSNYGL